jgi:hypothetical protein
MKSIQRILIGTAWLVVLLAPAGWASDPNRCAAGFNVERATWYLACDQVACSSHCGLIREDSTTYMSALTLTYIEAARHICSHGGRVWTSTEPRKTSCKALGLPRSAEPVSETPAATTMPARGAMPSEDALASRAWQFGRSDGTILVARLRLAPGGRIEGAAHSNESRWAVVGRELLFYDAAGKVSTRYDSFRQEDGRWVISGPFLLWGHITHVLKELK